MTQTTFQNRAQRRSSQRSARRIALSVARLSTTSLILAAGTGIAGSSVGFAGVSPASTYLVTNLNDNGPGSLRDAILQANVGVSYDLIAFQPGLAGSITLTSGAMSISESVAIQGPGAGLITIDANLQSRVFDVFNPASDIAVSLVGMTVTGGSVASSGGGIASAESLELDGMVIAGNHAQYWGGGVVATGDGVGAFVMRDTVITDNDVSTHGGAGLYLTEFDGGITIEDSTISDNVGTNAGGGLYMYAVSGPTRITNVTVSGNTSAHFSGGIQIKRIEPTVEVVIDSSTISGNTAQSDIAGGLGVAILDGDLTITNSTVTGNQASLEGGGIAIEAGTGDLTIEHSTIAANTASTATEIWTPTTTVKLSHSIVAGSPTDLTTDALGTVQSEFSLIGSTGGITLSDLGGSLLDMDPLLGPLLDRGGPTKTMLPAPSSPVINAGDPALVHPTGRDQRGLSRKNGVVDIGALETHRGTIEFVTPATTVTEVAGTLRAEVRRVGGSDGPISGDIATNPGTATAPSDFEAVAQQLNWADRDALPRFVEVALVSDTTDESDEVFSLTLTSAQSNAVGTTSTLAVTLIDSNDAPPTTVPAPPIAKIDGRIIEGGFARTADSTPTISGSGVPGATVNLYVIGADATTLIGAAEPVGYNVCATIVDAAGSWSCTTSPGLPSGRYMMTAVQVAGETRSPGSSFVLEISAPNGALPATGAATGPLAWLATGLAATGASLMGATTRRRRRSSN
jgi:Right handed beta helix region/Calx-beta domain